MDSGELPVAAILARTLGEGGGDWVGLTEEQRQSTIQEDGDSGEGVSSAGLDSHGKERGSSGLEESKGSDEGAEHPGTPNDDNEHETSVDDVEGTGVGMRVGHEGARDDSVEGINEEGDGLPRSQWNLRTDSVRTGNEEGRTVIVVGVDEVVEKPADVSISERESYSADPQSNLDSGDDCSTSMDGIAGFVNSGKCEGQVPLIGDETSRAVDLVEGKEEVDGGIIGGDHQTLEGNAMLPEEVGVANRDGLDSGSSGNREIVHQNLDCAISASQTGANLDSERMDGETLEVLKMEAHLGAQNEIGLEVLEARYTPCSEDIERTLEDDSHISNMTVSVPSPGPLSMQEMAPSTTIFKEDENLKGHHPYMTNSANDFPHLQPDGQVSSQDGSPPPFSKEMPGLLVSDAVTEENNASIYQELAACRSELQAMTSQKAEVDLLLVSAKEDIEVLRSRISELQSQIEVSHGISTATSAELSDLKAEVVVAQSKNMSLQLHLAAEQEDRMKLEDEKEQLVSENMKLARELFDQKEQLNLSLSEQIRLEKDLKEVLVLLEKLSKENLSLSICLDSYKVKLKDLDGLRIVLPQANDFHGLENCSETLNKVGNVTTGYPQESPGDCHRAAPSGKLESYATLSQGEGWQPIHNCRDSIYDAEPFFVWKRHVSEASQMILKLEKTIQVMHSWSMSLSRVGDMMTSDISKQILASESKEQTDESLPNEICLFEGGNPVDSLSSAKDQVKHLRNILEQMDGDVEMFSLLLKDKEEHKIRAKELSIECELQKSQNTCFKAKIQELFQVLSNCETLVYGLQNKLEDVLIINSDEVGYFVSQLDALQKEVTVSLSSFEWEQASTKDAVSLIINKLDESTGFLTSTDGDLTYRINASVGAAITTIGFLRDELESATQDHDIKCASYTELRKDFEDMQTIHNFAIEVLVQIHGFLRELTSDSCHKPEKKGAFTRNFDWLVEIKQDSEALTEQLRNMLHGQVQVVAAKEELEAKMFKNSKAVEGLKERCECLEQDLAIANNEKRVIEASLVGAAHGLKKLLSYFSTMTKKFEDSETVNFSGDASDGINILRAESINSQISQIEASMTLIIRKFEAVDEEVSLSKKYLEELESMESFFHHTSPMPLHILLKEAVIPKLMELGEIQNKLVSLSSSSFEKDEELQILKHSLNNMEEALKVKCSELDSKVAELEQLEMKLSSVREKLSIAVSKGKGLVAQRDNLKQALVEKTNELDKCLQELQTKETMLHEVETKLKSYSEVDRVEALESELSYIRNTATAFRDSFLIKDSILQRIEEVLEDLDLPEHFHSKDTVEKIELLARSVVNSSFMGADKEHRSPISGSQVETVFGVSDPSQEDQPVTPASESDELRRRYDELQRKFYGLAEQNDMLEQSLMERHGLIQRWEELLDMIDMPPYMRSMEPLVRLEWLGKALPEVQREQDSLLRKIEDLQESNGSLISHIEELQKKVSQLETALVSIENERDLLSLQIEKLKLENSELSGKESQYEESQSMTLQLQAALTSVENDMELLSVQVEKLRRENSELLNKESMYKESQSTILQLQAALASVENERKFLSLKIEELRLENSELSSKGSQCEGLQNKILQLEDAVASFNNEREILHTRVDKLMHENLELSQKEAQNELDSAYLQKDLSDLQEKMAENLANKVDHSILERINVIRIFVDDAIVEDGNVQKTSCDNPIDSLEASLRSLVDDYKMLLVEKSIGEGSGKLLAEDHKQSEEQKINDLLGEKDNNLMALKEQLNEASRNFLLIKEDNDAITEKHQLLLLDMEEMARQRNTLVEDNDLAVEKCQVLQTELRTLQGQLDEVSCSLKLVEEEKNVITNEHHALTLEMEEMIKMRDSLLMDREKALEKCQDLFHEVESLSKQRDTLVEQLNLEEQRSASVREKLNVAVRKGKGLVQQRDGLKQAVEEMDVKVEQLQNQLNQSNIENSSLKNKLVETERFLQDSREALDGILTALYAIDIGKVLDNNPVQWVEGIGKLLKDRLATALSKEHEAQKSRKAAELLLAELNEVQERADGIQEELSRVETALAICFRERNEAEAARADATSKLEQLVMAHSEERRTQASEILFLQAIIDDLRHACSNVLNLVANAFSKDFNFICSLEMSAKSVLKNVNGTIHSDLTIIPSQKPTYKAVINEGKPFVGSLPENRQEQSMRECCHLASQSLKSCIKELSNLKELVLEHTANAEQQYGYVTALMDAIQREMSLMNASSEPLSNMINHLQMSLKDKGTQASMLHRCLVLLFDACNSSIMEVGSRSGKEGLDSEPDMVKVIRNLPDFSVNEGWEDALHVPFIEDHIKTTAEMLLSAVRGSENMLEEIAESKQKKLKSLISDLQRELQEKDIQKNRICEELVSQIRDAESLAMQQSMNFESAQKEIQSLESQLRAAEDEKRLLEHNVNDLNDLEVSCQELKGRIKSLSESLSAKDQEIEALMQALDEEELQMESMQARNHELEKLVQEKAEAFESLEASRAKTMTKLSTTVNKFDELHQLSESLLVEVESLQSQLQERDSQISFLRQEVTRCTNDVLKEQDITKKKSNDIYQLQQWIMAMFSCFGHDVNFGNLTGSQLQTCNQLLDDKLSSIVNEFKELRLNSQNRDTLLQMEKDRVLDLLRKTEILQASLHEKESQIELYQQMRNSGQLSTADSSEPREIESMRNKGASSSSVVPLNRSARKAISDQAAIAIDLEQGNILEDEDDDKAHGFKSLTMSKVVPKFSRPVADKVDGLWVSVERLLMRQPSLRLGLIVYWIVLHMVLAASI